MHHREVRTPSGTDIQHIGKGKMPRKKTLVTRTVPITVCRVLCMDVHNKAAVVRDIEVVGKIKREAVFINEIKSLVEDGNLKYVSHEIITEYESLRAMTERTYYENSYEIKKH